MYVGMVAQASRAIRYTSETRLVATTISIVTRLSSFAILHFGKMQSTFHVISGTKEIGFGIKDVTDNCNDGCFRAFLGITGGVFVVASAVCTLWNKSHAKLADGLFLIASLMRLHASMIDYNTASSDRERTYAILGIMGSLSYLFASGFALFSCASSFLVYLSFLGSVFSVMQILHTIVPY